MQGQSPCGPAAVQARMRPLTLKRFPTTSSMTVHESARLWERHRWLPFLLPQIVFLALLAMGPAPPPTATISASPESGPSSRMSVVQALRYYPVYYGVAIAITTGTVLAFLPAYRQFPLRFHYGALLVGALGVFVWIGLCKLKLEIGLAGLVGLSWEPDGRAAFNPFAEFRRSPLSLWGFLAVRFYGMACLVPLIEELFLRGFVMRFFADADWWKVPIGTLTPAVFGISILYAVTSHPWHEALAAAAWFSMVTFLVWKTKNLWDGVVAHATTNLLLGIYVVLWEDWGLW